MSLDSVSLSEQSHVFTGLSSDVKPTAAQGAIVTNKFVETDTGDIYEYLGASIGWVSISNAGAMNIASVGVAGEAQDQGRILKVINGTRVKATWVAGVTEIEITVINESAADAFTSLVVCFDAPNDAVADGWLASASSATADAPIRVIPAGEARTLYFSGAGITRVDALDYLGATPLTMMIGAA